MALRYELAALDPDGEISLYRSQSLTHLAEMYLHFEETHPEHDLSVCAVEDSAPRELTSYEKAAMQATFDQHDAAEAS